MNPEGVVLEGDCVALMAGLDAESIDAIVTDPPYDLTSAKRGGLTLNLENPYGRARIGGFMGKTWDGTGVAFRTETWAEALRVAKPGAYLLAFGGTRTVHRMATAIEDAGWEIRDMLCWVHAQGFPKSLDVAKAIDKAAGAEGTLGEPKSAAHAGWIDRGQMRGDEGHEGYQRPWMDDPEAVERNARQYVPATPEAQARSGWGTAMKPAFEPIVMARKPLIGTVAANVTRYGTGALNIDATRIPINAADVEAWSGGNGFMRPGYERPEGTALQGSIDGSLRAMGTRHGEPSAERTYTEQGVTDLAAKPGRRIATARNRAEVSTDAPAGFGKGAEMGGAGSPLGRWPANVVLTDPVFDGGYEGVVGGGQTASGHMLPTETGHSDRTVFGEDRRGGYTTMETYGDAGGYSRFFLVPKADRGDREPVIRGQIASGDVESGPPGAGKVCLNCGSRTFKGPQHVCKPGCPEKVLSIEPTPRPSGRENMHPTVKPTELMRHLVRLVTPPGGLVLDPFLGSGSTALAAEAEGFRWLGMEMEADHVAIARARLEGTQRGLGL